MALRTEAEAGEGESPDEPTMLGARTQLLGLQHSWGSLDPASRQVILDAVLGGIPEQHARGAAADHERERPAGTKRQCRSNPPARNRDGDLLEQYQHSGTGPPETAQQTDVPKTKETPSEKEPQSAEADSRASK